MSAKRRTPVIILCPGCNRSTRPFKTSLREFPGTVIRQRADGRCGRCLNRAEVGIALDAPPAGSPTDFCRTDGCTEVISSRSKSKLCRHHYHAEYGRHRARSRARRDTSGDPSGDPNALTELPSPQELHPDDRKNRQALEDYWADRRRRGIPPEGTAA